MSDAVVLRRDSPAMQETLEDWQEGLRTASAVLSKRPYLKYDTASQRLRQLRKTGLINANYDRNCGVCFLPLPPSGKMAPRKYHAGPCAERAKYIDSIERRDRYRRDRAEQKPVEYREHFWKRVQKSDGCWLWVGAKTTAGYGMYHNVYAHRLMYSMEVGPIPPGAAIDHLCMVKRCVRPDHLQSVSLRENSQRYHAYVRGLISNAQNGSG